MLNGTITLQSEPNVGTTIAVILPATQVMKNELFHRNLKTHKYAASTILIVEDEYGNYLYINELLSETKARILYAADGQEAIDICRNEAQIDLVLMDIKMPVVDGYTATKLIKAFRSDLIIIAQTAYATDSDKEVFLECGFDGYICKPIQEDNLFAAINKYLIS